MTWQILICAGCGGAGSGLARSLQQARPELRVEQTECLSVCTDPASMAVQGERRATYVFSGLSAQDLSDVLAFIDAYQTAPDGWIEDARPLGRLRHCLVTRIPALAMESDEAK